VTGDNLVLDDDLIPVNRNIIYYWAPPTREVMIIENFARRRSGYLPNNQLKNIFVT